MKPSDIVAHLRKYCPIFTRNIAAGINWDAVRDSTQLSTIAAYVVPTDEKAGDQLYDNVIVQEVAEGIDIVVVFPQVDEAGYAVADKVSDVRRELCRALVGWTPPGNSEPFLYDGRSFLHSDRAKASYSFSFSSVDILGHAVLPTNPDDAETWHELELLGLPQFEGIDINVDVIAPIVDPNLKPDGIGPDGRTEFKIKEDYQND